MGCLLVIITVAAVVLKDHHWGWSFVINTDGRPVVQASS